MKFTPRSTARRTVGTDSESSVGPYEFPCAFPPIAQAPKPISETLSPVRPRTRILISRCERNRVLRTLRRTLTDRGLRLDLSRTSRGPTVLDGSGKSDEPGNRHF